MCCCEYGMHPSKKLIDLYTAKPFQGQYPEKATVVFWGRDANYSCRISEDDFFRQILSYHEDGVTFWEDPDRKCHHPFLLPDYPFPRTKDGVRYHRNFGSMNLSPKCAKHISFVELLDVPTTGNTAGGFRRLARQRLDAGLFQYIENLQKKLLKSGQKTIFISPTVLNDLEFISGLTKCFVEFNYNARIHNSAEFPVVYNNKNEDVEVLLAYHFSAAHFFTQREAIKTKILGAIAQCM